jgi:flagellar motor switch protein FliN/FliY
MSPVITRSVEAARDRLLTTLHQAAAALARTLPADNRIAPGQVDDGGAGRDALLPGEGARAVSGVLSGPMVGTVALTVSAALAEAIEHGPLVNQTLVAALEQAISDALAALDPELRVSALQEVGAEVALGEPGDGALAAVTVLDGAIHVATFGVVVRGVDDDEAPATAEAPAPTFEPLVQSNDETLGARSLDLLGDVEMVVTAELGRTRMMVRDLLSLTPGAVIELDRTAGSPVDLLVNGTLIARGEVVVIDEEFGVRISEIIGLETAARARART